MNEQEKGPCPTGPPSNMSKMGLYVLLHFFPFSWGKSRGREGWGGEERRWDWRGDSLFRAPRSVWCIPLMGCSENANSRSKTPGAQPHSHTPTRAPSLIITQPAPRDKTPTKAGPLTVLDRGQGLPLPHILNSFFLDICLFSFSLMNTFSGSTFGPSHQRGEIWLDLVDRRWWKWQKTICSCFKIVNISKSIGLMHFCCPISLQHKVFNHKQL